MTEDLDEVWEDIDVISLHHFEHRSHLLHLMVMWRQTFFLLGYEYAHGTLSHLLEVFLPFLLVELKLYGQSLGWIDVLERDHYLVQPSSRKLVAEHDAFFEVLRAVCDRIDEDHGRCSKFPGCCLFAFVELIEIQACFALRIRQLVSGRIVVGQAKGVDQICESILTTRDDA